MDAVLAMNGDAQHRTSNSGFRLLSSPERRTPPPDEELKSLLRDMQGRRRASVTEAHDDSTPDAA